MNKTQLIHKTVLKTGMTRKDTAETLEALIAVIEEAMVAGEPITILGHGSLQAREKPSHMKRNPLTGEMYSVPAKRWIKFVAGKRLMKRMNPGHPAYVDEGEMEPPA